MTGSLKRIMGPQNRPLPETPDQMKRSSVVSTTSSGSVFDAIKRPPSVVMEKIKQQSMLALDRISSNQERYRQQHSINGDRDPPEINGQTGPVRDPPPRDCSANLIVIHLPSSMIIACG